MTDESSEKVTGQSSPMPQFAEFVLTRRFPCAGLALLMFTAVIWGPATAGIPLLSLLLSLAGMTLHLLTPALFALIVLGGGLIYAMQVALIAAAVVTVVTGFDLMSGMLFLLLYALLPALAARSLGRIGGLSRSARLLAIGLLLAVMAVLLSASMVQGIELKQLVGQMVSPLFDVLASAIPAGDQQALDAVGQAREMMVWILPGFLAFGLWMIWWLDLLLGRKLAVKYGFFSGDFSEMLMIRFDRVTGVALIVATALANFTDGSLQYVAVSTAIMLAGLLALQGISVAHLWLRLRNMQVTLIVMYVMLFVWSAMVIPFIIVGLLDIWFDFRRTIMPANGEE